MTSSYLVCKCKYIHFSSTYAFTLSKPDKGRTEDILLRLIFIVSQVRRISRDVRESCEEFIEGFGYNDEMKVSS